VKLDTMNKEGNINFYNVFIEFYKFSVTEESLEFNCGILQTRWKAIS